MRLSLSLGLKKVRSDRKRPNLLVEPPMEPSESKKSSLRGSLSSESARVSAAEDLAVISPLRSESPAEGRKSGGHSLANFLVILFGALLICTQSASCMQELPPALYSTTTSPSRANETTSTNSTIDIMNITGGSESTANPVEADEPAEEEIMEPKDEDTSSGSRSLSKLLVDSAGSASDQLIGRLRSETDSERAVESPEDEDESVKDKSERETQADSDKRRSAGPLDEPEVAKSNSSDVEQLRLALETYAKWRSTGDDIIELFSRKFLPIIVEHGYDVDTQTVGGLLQVFNGIRALKPWAMKLLDASAKLSPGVLVGTQSDFGDFDECLRVRSDDPSGLGVVASELDESTGLPSSTLVGKYCLADIEFPKPPRVRLATRNEELKTDFAPIELRRPLLNFSQTAAFKDTIFVETGNFFHMLYVDPLRVGICLTNKIDADSFAQVFNKLFHEFRVTINFRGRCVTRFDKVVWTSQQRISAYVILLVCSLVVLSTSFDIVHSRLHESSNGRKPTLKSALDRYRPLLTAFSIIRNTKRLMKPQRPSLGRSSRDHRPSMSSSSSSSTASSPSTDRRSSLASSAANLISPLKDAGSPLNMLVAPKVISSRREEQPADLLCLHGIRVITMAWMIVNHTYLFGGFFVLWAHRRLIDIAEWPKSLSFQLVLNGWLTVETYFFLSAAIIVLNVMPLMKANKFSYLPYIIHRLVRLLPAYAGLVALNFLWPLISSGPVWLVKGRSFIQTPCENHLWTNFLFINNWIWPEKQCMVHTWFLSADFQLYLLAPIVVYLLYRRPALGHALNIMVAIVASVLSGFVIYANKLMPTTLINKLEFDSIKQQLSYSYFATYQHLGPYCLGILIGYLLYKRPHMKLPKYLTWLLWLFLPPLSFTTLLLTYLWNGAYEEPSLINPSPLVSAFYVAIHRTIWTSLIAWIVFACSTDMNILWEACGNFIASIIMGYFLNIAFESPIINLEQATLGRTEEARTSQDCNSDSKSDLISTKESPAQSGQRERALLRPQSASSSSKVSSSSSSSDEHANCKSSNSVPNSISGDEQSIPEIDSESRAFEGKRRRLESDAKLVKPSQSEWVAEFKTPPGALVKTQSGQNQPRATRYELENSLLSLPGPGSSRTLAHAQSRGQLASYPQRPSQYATLTRYANLRPSSRDDFWPESIYQTLSQPPHETSNHEYPARNHRNMPRESTMDGLHQARYRPNREMRYNTLTGAGAREWRDLTSEPIWRRIPNAQSTARSELARSTNDQYSHLMAWPKSGLMIPRVDSTTLKRQHKLARSMQTNDHPANSILEEPSLAAAESEDD